MGAEDTEMVRMLVNGLSKRDVARRLMLTMQEVQVRLEKIGESIG
jgi:DNA-binding NarL/FixJ family response regulator